MSQSEARAAYETEIKEDLKQASGEITGLRLNKVKIGDIQMTPLIELSGDPKAVHGVELSMIDMTGLRDRAFGTLKALLINKYGPATSEDLQSRMVVWTFPSTIIRLEAGGTALLEITYKPMDKKAKDVI
jgi:hypothetical protein